MTVSKWMHVGTVLKMNALNYPDKLGVRTNSRVSLLRNGMKGRAALPMP